MPRRRACRHRHAAQRLYKPARRVFDDVYHDGILRQQIFMAGGYRADASLLGKGFLRSACVWRRRLTEARDACWLLLSAPVMVVLILSAAATFQSLPTEYSLPAQYHIADEYFTGSVVG